MRPETHRNCALSYFQVVQKCNYQNSTIISVVHLLQCLGVFTITLTDYAVSVSVYRDSDTMVEILREWFLGNRAPAVS